jgi:hypothetical protein
MQMEQLRMDSYEAESAAHERRLLREYGRLWKIVEPFARGNAEFSESSDQ